ncbi:hypothetical protein Tco_0406992 [Tanacetum coccineum]
MYINSQNSCDFTAVTIKGESEERRTNEGIIRNYYDREDGETTRRFEVFCLVGVVLLMKDCRMINLKVSKRRAFWRLNEDILKITILKTNTPYPSRKIRRIRACTHQRPQRNKAQYALSTEDQHAVLEIWNEYNILEDIKRGPYFKKSLIRRIEPTSRPSK